MGKLLSSEFRRLFHSRIYYLGMLFMLGFAVLLVVSRYRDTVVSTLYADLTADGLWFMGGTYFSLVVSIFVGMFIGAEHEDGAIRNKLAVGHTRSAIFFSDWLVSVAAALMMHLIYIVTILGLGYALLGAFLTPVKTLVLCTLASLGTVVAMTSLYLVIALLIQSKATGAIVCIVMALVLMFSITTVFQRLMEPEYFEHSIEMNENGELVQGDRVENKDYLSGTAREVHLFLMDFLPEGQMIQYAMGESEPENLDWFPLYSLLFGGFFLVGGYICFRRRDIR